jgi:hypothetical protein
MPLTVIESGFGRTGTASLKRALEMFLQLFDEGKPLPPTPKPER